MVMLAPLQLMKSARLGKAKWTDPERRQSIKDDTRVKMEWRFRTPLHIMKCWVALQPARPCLLEAMEKVEILLQDRNHDVWEGENTSPGCSYDVAMHGRSLNDAQPAVIFCSPSRICRRNAENIIVNEDIAVDSRGIGMEYYNTGPDFFASDYGDVELGTLGTGEEESRMFPELLTNLPSSSRYSFKSSSSSNRNTPSQEGTSRQQSTACTVNGSLISVQSTNCTLGGLISIDGELYGLTVAHAFERDGILNDNSHPTPAPIICQINRGRIGSLLEKRYVPLVVSKSQRDLDWALCSLDRTKVHLTNNISLPDGTTIYPTQIALKNPSDADVWVHTGTTGLVKGFLTGAYSLVALPGSRTFQRMWIVVLDRLIRPGDCGSWVIDSKNWTWYGQIVAAKPETAVAYIVLARDIFRNIRDQFGGRHVRMPIESDFVNEAVSVVKRQLSRSSSTAQGSSQQDIIRSCISGKAKTRNLQSGSRKSKFRRILLMRRSGGKSTYLAQENLAAKIELQSAAHIAARESFQQTIFQTAIGNGGTQYGQEWYMRYLESCFREHLKFYLLPNLLGLDQATLGASSIGEENMEIIYRFLVALVRQLLDKRRETTICELVDDLKNNIACDFLEEDDDRMRINGLILTAIGWLTMSMPYPKLHPNDESKYEGRDVFINRQDLGDSCDQPLSILFRKFKLFASMIDPPPVYTESGQTHNSQYFLTSTICFYKLRKVANIEIIWTEQLPLHLEFDRRRRTLTLFAFPSFARIHYHGKSNTILAKILHDLYYSAYEYSANTRLPNNASVEDLCREILLTYRLIFGLDSQSCRQFNRECANEMRLSSDFDPLLGVLCGQKWDSPEPKSIFEEIWADPPASFYLTSDFPHLGHRLYKLHDFVQGQYPSSLRTLWYDRRDTTRWFTFWMVLIIGGTTIILGLLQNIFQIWQLVLTQQQLHSQEPGKG